MKSFLLLIAFLALVPVACCGFSLPPDIEKALTTADIADSGGLFLKDENYDRGEFDRYIRKNWREISDQVESLPLGSNTPSRSMDEKRALEFTQYNFAVACEVLPPTEYLEFMEKWIGLYEAGKISYQVMELGTGVSTEKRRWFLAVNWEDPRIQALFPRLIAAASEDAGGRKESQISYLKSVFTGELAANYRTNLNEGDDLPFPDTLPGIKLKRPYTMSETTERMWRDYEKSWEANQRALSRRDGGNSGRSKEADGFARKPFANRTPLIAGLLLLVIPLLVFVWKKLARR